MDRKGKHKINKVNISIRKKLVEPIKTTFLNSQISTIPSEFLLANSMHLASSNVTVVKMVERSKIEILIIDRFAE